jgi:hypothetical protein
LCGITVSDTLTIVFPVVPFIYFFGLGHYKEYGPYGWCRTYYYLVEVFPDISHTCSIWITVALALQRYVCVCHPLKARALFTVRKTRIVICIMCTVSLLTHILFFLQLHFISVSIPSRIDASTNVTGCDVTFAQWISPERNNFQAVACWFRTTIYDFVPCLLLIIFDVLMLKRIRLAETQRQMLQQHDHGQENSSHTHRDSRRTTRATVTIVAIICVVSVTLNNSIF